MILVLCSQSDLLLPFGIQSMSSLGIILLKSGLFFAIEEKSSIRHKLLDIVSMDKPTNSTRVQQSKNIRRERIVDGQGYSFV